MNKWEVDEHQQYNEKVAAFVHTCWTIYFLFLSDEGPPLETLDCRIGSTPTFLYFDLYLYFAYAAPYVYMYYVYIYIYILKYTFKHRLVTDTEVNTGTNVTTENEVMNLFSSFFIYFNSLIKIQ